MTWEENQYLIHYGIPNQKKGVRRFQNPDGSLTPAGRDRYGVMARRVAKKAVDTGNDLIRRSVGGDEKSAYAKNRVYKDQQKLEKAKQIKNDRRREKKVKKFTERIAAQKKMDKDLETYRNNTSTSKLVLQNLLMGKSTAHRYRNARAKGETNPIEAYKEANDPFRRMSANKRKYGKRIVYGDNSGEKFMIRLKNK